jgi:hypothetical protein
MAFVGQAARHHRRLRRVEAADGPAGDGDEHQGPHGELLRVQVLHGFDGEKLIAFYHEHADRADRHKNEDSSEQRVDAADDLVHRHDGG